MRQRQVHLDFHTSPLIEGIGSAFEPEAFAEAYAGAGVDSVTLFSKCHHGLSYHPTKVGRMHPHLSFDLLRAQMDALKARGIGTPIYLSAAWDEQAAAAHPDWQAVLPDGRLAFYSDEPYGGWAFLDFASPYLDYLCAQVDEVMTTYPDGDGIFIDICFQRPSISPHAQAGMAARGLDWRSEADRATFGDIAAQEFFDRVTEVVRGHRADCPLFFNSGHIRKGHRAHYARHYTHLEVESLPTAGWGYDHFPTSARYVDAMGVPFLGMTGKFATTWGEFGGYKRPEALRYECAAMAAHGAGCSIGDHLHPTGAVEPATIRLIASAYQPMVAAAPWLEGSTAARQIALVSAEAMAPGGLAGEPSHHAEADDGAVRVLLEGGFTFDVVDGESDLSPYSLVICPDAVAISPAFQARLEEHLARGGRLLLTGASGLGPGGPLFDIGAVWEGPSPMRGGDYLFAAPEIAAEGVDAPIFTYLPSERLRVTDGESLGAVHDPYIDRRPGAFSGHVHAPYRPEPSGYAAAVQKGGMIHAAHPIFSCYYLTGEVALLEIAENLIRCALAEQPLVETSLPRAGRALLRQQDGREVLHLLHANPVLRGTLRGNPVQPIQDISTLHDISVDVAVRRPVTAVRLVPDGEALPFEASGKRVRFILPRLTGQAMVEIVYG
ncbi:alpha-amylase family protein [Pseudoroseicyclus tamaricis]|uniref:Beta-galactosidase trimerisation domain-containing protein n=1 Tax=Pseudoroseicyclus tamaricis TaxID=2705421 RepID=A0A6B2K0J7_9RHOB|nr:alpha-amylase family protein [Pseudoroseicyclus tamaricis]NDU99835.1 hypothetical protein [Pseudoroseicyclus tamaricis]